MLESSLLVFHIHLTFRWTTIYITCHTLCVICQHERPIGQFDFFGVINVSNFIPCVRQYTLALLLCLGNYAMLSDLTPDIIFYHQSS